MKRAYGSLRPRRKAPCYIFEGTWWGARETPLVLPFLQALEALDGGVSLSHKARAKWFLANYGRLARDLGFSGLSSLSGRRTLIPPRLGR